MYPNITHKLKHILITDQYLNNTSKLSSTIQWDKELKDEIISLTNFLIDDNSIRMTTLARVYCILNDIYEQPTCKHCGNPVGFIGWKHGFREYCSNSCQRNYYEKYILTEELDKKRKHNASIAHKQTYINNPNLGKEISDKRLETWYGYPIEKRMEQSKKWKMWYYGMSPEERKRFTKNRISKIKFDSEEFKNKSIDPCVRYYDAIKNSDIVNNRNRIAFYNMDEDSKLLKQTTIKNTMIERYGVKNPYQIPAVRDKIDLVKRAESIKNRPIAEKIKSKQKEYQTKLRNKSFSGPISKQELKLLTKIKSNYPQYTIVQQYGDERYPFACDFYIKELDLFIEYQGSQFHQTHPYDPNNEDDVKLTNRLLEMSNKEHGNYYKAIYNNWTNKDVIKRNIAKENKINFEEIWNYKISDDELKTIISKYETEK